MKSIALATLASSLIAFAAQASPTPITILPGNSNFHALTAETFEAPLKALVEQNFDLAQYRAARVQIVLGADRQVSRLVVHLQSKGTHRVQFAALHLNDKQQVVSVENNYSPIAEDLAQQPGTLAASVCPDITTEFIAFAPNNNSLELGVAKDVAQAARAKGLKTVELLQGAATRQAYLNYMSCPNLKGNFYDGDSNPQEFITFDGVIEASEMAQFRFKYHVVNIWLACEAFNDPMLSSVTKSAQAQKYAAGINDLLVGPSDYTAKCAMIAAINGRPMTQAFNDCKKQYDSPQDQFGWGGDGADLFGH